MKYVVQTTKKVVLLLENRGEFVDSNPRTVHDCYKLKIYQDRNMIRILGQVTDDAPVIDLCEEKVLKEYLSKYSWEKHSSASVKKESPEKAEGESVEEVSSRKPRKGNV